MARTTTLLDDALELAALLKPAWAQVSDRIPDWHPRNEGTDPDGEPAGNSDGAGADGEGDDTATGAGGDSPKPGDTDWKAYARKHERDAKKARKELDDLRAKLAEVEEASKTEQEKQLDQARKEAADQARAEAMAELRAERLNAAIARHAAGKFVDVDDAIRLLDVDPDDLFDGDGKVQTDALSTALDELLEAKPHLKAGPPQGGRPHGTSDAGRGSSAMTAAEATKLAKSDPARFNEMFDKGLIPASALGATPQ